MRSTLALLALGFVVVGGCTTPAPQESLVAELRAALAAYEQGDEGVTEDRLTALFARLDAEVAMRIATEAEAPPASRAEITAEREKLEAERRDLQAAYVKARLARLGTEAGNAIKGVGEQIGQGLEDAGRKMREAMQE